MDCSRSDETEERLIDETLMRLVAPKVNEELFAIGRI